MSKQELEIIGYYTMKSIKGNVLAVVSNEI